MSTAIKPPDVPPLENGDRLTRDEFERRYEAMTGVKKAELIEGVVHMPSPVRLPQHGEPHAALVMWLGVYWASVPALRFGDNATVRLDPNTELQPDALLMLPTAGRAEVGRQGYVEGAPELAIEVASSSVSIDLGPKLEAYRRNGVREYLVWRVLDDSLDWYVLRGDAYELLPVAPDGLLRSTVFPGLWLDPAALLAREPGHVLGALNRGLASPEHADFVKHLDASAR